MIEFGECTKCNKWADVPKEFNESRHFLKCPLCGSAMFLVRGFKPEDLALRESNKVKVTEFIKHNG